MLKALLKKQLLEIFNRELGKNKKGQSAGKKTATTGLLYLLIFGLLGFSFFSISRIMCEGMVSAGYTWLYFAIMGLIAVAVGVVGSVFSTYSSLYLAKDNELLLSMPIKPRVILTVRLLAVLFTSMFFELVVMLPAVISYCISVETVTVGTIVLPLLTIPALAAVIMALSCLLGWLVALISTKLKGKNYITVVLSLGFMIAYYTLYDKAFELLSSIAEDPQQSAASVKRWLYPFYVLGKGAAGDAVSVFLCLAVCVALFALIYLVLNRSFIRIANNLNVKAISKSKVSFAHSTVSGALLRKELKHFTSSPTYMLNCGLGTVVLPIFSVVLLVKLRPVLADSGLLHMMANSFGSGVIALVAAAAVCATVSFNDLTAPSVSLEGNGIWILQSLPVHPMKVLTAKLKLQLYLTAPMAIIFIIAVIITAELGFFHSVLVFGIGIAYMFLSALGGLCLNLKMPKLDWTNEAVPVKQSAPVAVCLMGGLALVVALGGIYYLLRDFIDPNVYLVFLFVLMTASDVLLFRWLKNKGTKIFAYLR